MIKSAAMCRAAAAGRHGRQGLVAVGGSAASLAEQAHGPRHNKGPKAPRTPVHLGLHGLLDVPCQHLPLDLGPPACI